MVLWTTKALSLMVSKIFVGACEDITGCIGSSLNHSSLSENLLTCCIMGSLTEPVDMKTASNFHQIIFTVEILTVTLNNMVMMMMMI